MTRYDESGAQQLGIVKRVFVSSIRLLLMTVAPGGALLIIKDGIFQRLIDSVKLSIRWENDGT